MRIAAVVSNGLAAGLLAALLHCGGSTDMLGTPPGDDVAGDDAVPPNGEVPAQHRPAAVACASGPTGGVACNDDAECNGNTPGLTPNHCLHGTCGPDQCDTDADCAGGVCSCDGASRGYGGATANVCVTAGCHVDADCGPDGYCSPTVSSSCGAFYGVQGYYCHQRGDACIDDSDCAADGGAPGAPYCAYDPSVGRWACETGFCAG
jgi:hypothetical protein